MKKTVLLLLAMFMAMTSFAQGAMTLKTLSLLVLARPGGATSPTTTSMPVTLVLTVSMRWPTMMLPLKF